MFDVLVYLYENYWRPDACPEPKQLSRKLSAVGFEAEEINDALNRLGADARYIDAQIGYNRDKLDAVEGGLGALIDADIAKEAARLQALQIRQQLGTQTLSITNQAPQALLSLFGGR